MRNLDSVGVPRRSFIRLSLSSDRMKSGAPEEGGAAEEEDYYKRKRESAPSILINPTFFAVLFCDEVAAGSVFIVRR